MNECQDSSLFDSKNRLIVSKGDYADVANEKMKIWSEQRERGEARDNRWLSTTKLRSIYGQIMNVFTRINEPGDFERCKADIQYLKVKFAYEAGRERSVKKFIEDTLLGQALDSVKTYDEFVLFCRYAESLVAYFKFYGGKDN